VLTTSPSARRRSSAVGRATRKHGEAQQTGSFRRRATAAAREHRWCSRVDSSAPHRWASLSGRRSRRSTAASSVARRDRWSEESERCRLSRSERCRWRRHQVRPCAARSRSLSRVVRHAMPGQARSGQRAQRDLTRVSRRAPGVAICAQRIRACPISLARGRSALHLTSTCPSRRRR
jgi:hypothetical protein